MRNVYRLAILCISLIFAFSHSAHASGKLSEIEYLRLFPKGRLTALVVKGKPDDEGKTQSSRSTCWYLIGAVVSGDTDAAEKAWHTVDTAFSYQKEDGAVVNENNLSKAANVRGTFFYLQELAHAIIIIQQSNMEPRFHDRINALLPKIRKACVLLSNNYDVIISDNTLAINRIVIAAKAFGLCGVILKDEKLIATSKKLIRHAISYRDKDGIFIEKGGRDSSYNAVSIFFGEVLALNLNIPEFEAVLPAAVKWEMSRVKPSGEVDVTDNTRTGVGKEFVAGHPKNVNTKEVVFAFTLYGLIYHDAKTLEVADRVFKHMQSSSAQ
jgi:hypothetical protein